ncbi:SRPBCC family protein [Lacibacterium aquatile]|uniref:SRPBCC family protein n=1 Tax=Lacibacterium aquatile TaxID=1168082 RepID=A0ABW5DPP9_9PROT
MSASFDPARDLTISRIIKAPRMSVWKAWTDPARFEKWWIPAPALCRVERMEVRPGGSLVTHMSENGGPFLPHVDFCYLAVEEGSRLVVTDALRAGWRPAQQSFMTAILSFQDHPQGTEYSAHVMHKTDADRKSHEEMGFHDGWGTVAAQLAALVEAEI